MMNTIKRFWALCLNTYMKLVLYEYAIIIVILTVNLQSTERKYTHDIRFYCVTSGKPDSYYSSSVLSMTYKEQIKQLLDINELLEG